MPTPPQHTPPAYAPAPTYTHTYAYTHAPAAHSPRLRPRCRPHTSAAYRLPYPTYPTLPTLRSLHPLLPTLPVLRICSLTEGGRCALASVACRLHPHSLRCRPHTSTAYRLPAHLCSLPPTLPYHLHPAASAAPATLLAHRRREVCPCLRSLHPLQPTLPHPAYTHTPAASAACAAYLALRSLPPAPTPPLP